MQVAPSGMSGLKGCSSASSHPPRHHPWHKESVLWHRNGFTGNSSLGSPSTHQHMEHPSRIYTAVYSNVNVYEMELNGIAVMKRRTDSWLNATQILKVAGVDKGKRTKVLEKEILTGEHEKVQGGYGKYQGTWINYRRGREFCRQYGVEDLLRPLLDYGVDGRSQGLDADTPTKEQAMAANRKRFYANTMDGRVSSAAASGTFFSNISSTASNAIAAMDKVARMNSPTSCNMVPGHTQPLSGSQASSHGECQQRQSGLRSERSFSTNGGDSTYATQPQVDGPPTKRLCRHNPHAQRNDKHDLVRDGSPTEAGDSSVHQMPYYLPATNSDVRVPLSPLPKPSDHLSDERRKILLNLFRNQAYTVDHESHTTIANLSGAELDTPLDCSANTALFMAASRAEISLVRVLISKGADIYRGNAAKETPLMAAVQTTECHKKCCFPGLLELLAPLIEVRDGTKRTILHHIANQPLETSKYYLEALLEFLVRNNTGQSSQFSSGGKSSRIMGLMRFMSEMVNAKDGTGNTALDLATRMGNHSIIQQLLEIRSVQHIVNCNGPGPANFGVEADRERPSCQIGLLQRSPTSGVNEAKTVITSTMSSFLSQIESQFNAEIRPKQEKVDRKNTAIQAESAKRSKLIEAYTSLLKSQQSSKERAGRMRNLTNAMENEQCTLAAFKPTSGEHVRAASEVRGGVSGADSVLSIPFELGHIRNMSPDSTNSPDRATLSSSCPALPTVRTLEAALAALDNINSQLQTHATDLRERNGAVQTQYCKVVSLCIGVPEREVDSLLEGLLKAVESEPGNGVEVGRVREFLRKVDFEEK